jgi:mono/diheme cytochrome c family protein
MATRLDLLESFYLLSDTNCDCRVSLPRVNGKHIGLVAIGIVLLIAMGTPALLMGPQVYAAAWRAYVAGPRQRPLRDVKFERTEERRKRGEYLSQSVLGCFRCHSDRAWNAPGAPPVTGKEGSGHVFTEDGRPWLVAPNITSDAETGNGRWTDDMIARAIREGIGHDGRMLHPQMWYGAFHDLSDEDVASVVVYLRSLPAIHNPLPQTRIPFGRRINYANLPQPITGPVPSPDQSDAVKRGEYLANIADCAGCHTSWYHPDAPIFAKLFGGGNAIAGPNGTVIVSPNITSDASGISYYDEPLFISAMRTGHVRARVLNPVMPWWWYGKLTDDDLKAVFAYLRAQPQVKHVVDNTEPPTFCRLCQEKHGSGDRN